MNPRRLARLGLYAFAISAALFFLAPLYVVLCTAFKSPVDLRGASLLTLPTAPSWLAFRRAWSHACTGLDCNGIGVGFWNSIEITLPAVLLSVSLGALNGFALALWRLRGATVLLGLLLVGAFIPYQVILYPLVKLVAAAGLFGSLPGVIGVHVIFSLPILTLLFRNFYASIPPEIVDAARIDGGSFWSIFWHVIRPLSSGMLAVAVILQFTGVWNDYLFGLIFAGREHLPMTVQLNNLVDRTYGENDYSVDMAATVLTALPPLLIYLLSGRYFVRGVTAGAVKG